MKSKYYIILAISLLFLLKISPSYGIGDTTFVFTYDASGNRTERIIDLTKSAEITASSSSLSEEKLIEAELSSLDIKIYPNPTKGVLKVEIPEIGDIKPTLVVYNLQGKQLVNKTVSNQISTINLSEQPPGMYIMKIVNGAESLDWKIIKD
ncbi:T9SS type A sorting domain-containing protein [Draconibacterium sp. IB214405]|uniref:T9SS type A sorting domain-containing protein n=1 Tax=Draconibacterium sp. IB214405 TaxID=3097352 RepID=UPI002A0D9CB3|nr:T9SS type A sorting domain-containing protein [Draconibacterium sp. IB214405]MDX8339758.1 T9SS type A sorting domain-containing protein [Draconibacterium sp. IB214405]